MLTAIVGLLLLNSSTQQSKHMGVSASEVAEPFLHPWVAGEIDKHQFTNHGKKLLSHRYALHDLDLKRAFAILKPELLKRGWRVGYQPTYAEDTGMASFLAPDGRKILLNEYVGIPSSDLEMSEWTLTPSKSSAKRPGS